MNVENIQNLDSLIERTELELDRAVQGGGRISRAGGTGFINSSEHAELRSHRGAAAKLGAELRSLRDLRVTVREHRTYDDPRYDFVDDLYRASLRGAEFDSRAREARRRIDRHQAEVRALGTESTGGGLTASASSQMAAFVAPAVLEEQIAVNRQAEAALLAAFEPSDLPEYGMTVYTPNISAAVGSAAQTEGSGLPSTGTPTTGLLTGASVQTESVAFQPSQQLIDRSGPMGLQGVVRDQLAHELAAAIDVALVTAVEASATAVTGQTTSTATNIQKDWGTAASGIATAPGVKLRAQFAAMRAASFYTAVSAGGFTQLSSDGVPHADGKTGDTGIVLPGGGRLIIDDNIASGHFIVGSPKAWNVGVTQPRLFIAQQYGAANLLPALILYAYFAFAPRYVAGAASVSGAQY